MCVRAFEGSHMCMDAPLHVSACVRARVSECVSACVRACLRAVQCLCASRFDKAIKHKGAWGERRRGTAEGKGKKEHLGVGVEEQRGAGPHLCHSVENADRPQREPRVQVAVKAKHSDRAAAPRS